jgi:hypothetical protein
LRRQDEPGCVGYDAAVLDSVPADAGIVATDSFDVDTNATDVGSDSTSAVCNALVNVASPIQPENRGGTMPTPKGGPIADGTYVETSSIIFTGTAGTSGPRGEKVQATIVVSGNEMQVVQKLEGAKETRGTATITAASPTVNVTYACPSKFTTSWTSYDADATQIVFYDPKIKLAVTFTKE